MKKLIFVSAILLVAAATQAFGGLAYGTIWRRGEYRVESVAKQVNLIGKDVQCYILWKGEQAINLSCASW